MKIVTKISELDHPHGILSGLVPTMGAFHEGHLELMRTAKRENDRVIVSLFVNPTQFGHGEDFERYPRDPDRDARLAEEVGVDVLFCPSVEEMYPKECSKIIVPEVTDLWEGAFRPSHFAGVATVVCKLLNIARCDVAYFGQKDLQQCIVISRMVADLNIPVVVSRQQTVRELDGLAMSSRNKYLSDQERAIAPKLYEQLTACKGELISHDLTVSGIEQSLANRTNLLAQSGFLVDYFDLIDTETMHSLRSTSRPSALIVAARLGKTRLIDSLLM